jgi:hypothetical protein
MDVIDVGRFAIISDPTGAALGLWQPRRHTGAELVNEPVSLAWNELNTRDTQAAQPFGALRRPRRPAPSGLRRHQDVTGGTS